MRTTFDDTNPELGRCFVIERDGQPIGQVNYNEIYADPRALDY